MCKLEEQWRKDVNKKDSAGKHACWQDHMAVCLNSKCKLHAHSAVMDHDWRVRSWKWIVPKVWPVFKFSTRRNARDFGSLIWRRTNEQQGTFTATEVLSWPGLWELAPTASQERILSTNGWDRITISYPKPENGAGVVNMAETWWVIFLEWMQKKLLQEKSLFEWILTAESS